MSVNIPITVILNGESIAATVPAREPLVDFLRDHMGLTGAHVGCAHGVCGACTVRVDGVSVRACLMLAAQADGARVDTVEGLTDSGAIADLQSAFHRHNAVQCGFCTPGMILSSVALLSSNSDPSHEEIKQALSGNLCRCTGYGKIFRAVERAAETMRGKG